MISLRSVVFVLVLCMATTAMAAQAPKAPPAAASQAVPAAPAVAAAPKIPSMSVEDSKNLQLLFTKRSLIQEQAQRLQLEYEKNIKMLTDDYAKLTQELSQAVDSVYAQTKVNRKEFDIDLTKGEFIKIEPKKPE